MDPPLLCLFNLPRLHPCFCLCALNVTVWPAFSPSILSSTPSDSKVLQSGARSTTLAEGNVARELEQERPCAFLSPFWSETIHGCKKRKRVFNIRTSPSARGHVTPAYASTVSDMKSAPGRLLLSLAYESQNKSVLNEVKTLSKPLFTCAERANYA